MITPDSVLHWESWSTAFAQAFLTVKQNLSGIAPSLLAVAVILFVGWMCAKLARILGRKLGEMIDRFFLRLEKRHDIKSKARYANILALFFYWVVLIYVILFSIQFLHLPGISQWLKSLALSLPNIISGLIIVFFGFMFGAIAKNAILSNVAPEDTEPYFLAQATRLCIIMIFVLWGVSQTGINIRLFIDFMSIIITAVVGAMALGFGLGSSAHVANIIASYNLKRHYKIGEHIALNDIQGTILDITSTTLVLETEEGTVVIPSKLTNELICKKNV